MALWLPYMQAGLTQPELDTSRATARTAGVPLIDASVVADQIGTIDGVHPVTQGRVVMASHVSAVLSGDPIGAAIRLAGAVAAGRGSTSTQVQEASADPSAPAANGAVLYTKDNGAGKTQLCVRFATGAVQVIATQP